jgi:hypothetical protein
MRSSDSSANTPAMIAAPPATTGMRSSRSPASASLRRSPAAMSCSRNHSSPRAEMPRSACPFFARISAMERAVPDEPTTSFQPSFSKRAAIVCTCSRAASSACLKAFFSMRPSGKKRSVKLTQPM